MSTDTDWENWGKQNPYYGVLSSDDFKGKTLPREAAETFYKLGESDIDEAMQTIAQLNNNQIPKFRSAVDFGCGVGRLTVPIARYAKAVRGLDVSPSMVKLAQHNIPRAAKQKVSFKTSDDSLHNLPASFDFVYSYIVLQHIPVTRGMSIMARLLSNLDTGGFAALHVTYSRNAPRHKKVLLWFREHVPLLHPLANVLTGKPAGTPLMRMHLYDLNKVLRLYEVHGITNIHVSLTDHGGYKGAMLIGKKQ